MTFLGPDGKQYIAVYAGVGGAFGAVAFKNISAKDPYAALAQLPPSQTSRTRQDRGALCMSSVTSWLMARLRSSRVENSFRRNSFSPLLLWKCTLSLLALGLLGCGQQPIEVAPEGAASAIETAVGPIPGSGQRARHQVESLRWKCDCRQRRLQVFQLVQLLGLPRRARRWRNGTQPARRSLDLRRVSPITSSHQSTEGRSNGMPSWGTKIPEEQIWKIVTYIEALNTPVEIDPPTLPLATQQAHMAPRQPQQQEQQEQ